MEIENDALTALSTHRIVTTLARVFAGAGAELALVGGVVRDAVCGSVADDFDFTTNLHPTRTKELLAPLGTLWTSGETFGTVGVKLHGEKVEVTTYRSESYDPQSRKPVVTFGSDLFDDLLRRDLTINSMALRLHVVGNRVRPELVDPFDGAQDLAAGLLRTPRDPEETFSDDPLRILRAVRFAALREMDLDPDLLSAATAVGSRLEVVAPERRLAELEKLLKDPQACARALELARCLGVAEYLFGSFEAVDPRVVAGIEGTREELLTLFGTLDPDAEASMRALRMGNSDIRMVRSRVELVNALPGADLRTVRTLVRKFTNRDLQVAHRVLAVLERPEPTDLLLAALGEPDLRRPLPVDGSDALELGLSGPEVGRALARVRSELFDRGTMDRERALALLAQ